MTTGKTIALTSQTFVGKVMSLLFNMLSRIDGETMDTLRDFIFGGFKTTADMTAVIKRSLLLGRKAMTNLDRILKSRDYIANKGPSSQSYGFSSSHVWM